MMMISTPTMSFITPFVMVCTLHFLQCKPSLPWFSLQIPLIASEDIETQICRDETTSTEDVYISKLRTCNYVQ